MPRFLLSPILALLGLSTTVSPASAAEVSVVVTGATNASTGAKDSKATVACALFRTAPGFPMEDEKAFARMRVPVADPAVCSFKDVPEGAIAVAVAVDSNGNGKTDTNLLGIPKEAWGVSNNVRPAMRAPRFAEAQVMLNKSPLQISVAVKR